jgi:hypothetical protein
MEGRSGRYHATPRKEEGHVDLFEPRFLGPHPLCEENRDWSQSTNQKVPHAVSIRSLGTENAIGGNNLESVSESDA